MTATLGRNDYALTASGEVSSLPGFSTGRRVTESNGARAGSGPEPQRYSILLHRRETQTVQIGFDRGAV